MTETSAIERYIPKKYGKREILGKSPKDEAIVDCLSGVLRDVGTSVATLFWDKEYEAKKAAAL